MKCSMLKYKWMYIAVFCCAMFAACEQTSNIPDEKAPISFGSGRTHVSGEYNAKLWGYTTGTNGYWVFAGTTTDGLTEGVGARYNSADNSLTPDVTRYWADNQTYNFYSVWPVVANNGISDIKFNKTNNQLTFSADISNQNENTDFCIAAAIGEQGNADRTTAVNLTYKHALAKVQLYGYSTVSLDAQLTNLTITVPKSAKATCTLNDDTEEATETEENSLNITYASYSEAIGLSVTNTENPFVLEETSKNADGTKVLEKLVLPITSRTIHVSATFKMGEGTKTVETDIENVTWQPGKNYIYKFYIQPAGPITFGTYEIRDWEDGGSVNITMK